jgi:hypothetical protein
MIVGDLGKKKRKANAEALTARRQRKADSQKWLSHCEGLRRVYGIRYTG